MAWLGTYAKRILVTAKYTDGGTQRIDATQTDFPSLVYISAACGIGNAFDASCVFDELQNDANALKTAFTTSDGTTECYAEIVKWDDANEKAWVFVKIPTASHTADTPLYLYYDSAHAASTKDGSAGNKVGLLADGSAATHGVWDSDFVSVCHMVDDPDNTAIKDSVAEVAGAKTGAGTPAEIAGKSYVGQDFDPDEDINLGDEAAYNITDDLTVEACIYPNDRTTVILASKYQADKREWLFRMTTTAGKLSVQLGDPNDGSYEGEYTSDGAEVSSTTWWYIAFTFDGSEAEADRVNIHVNAAEVAGSVADGAIPATLHNGTANLLIGQGFNTAYWDGIIDEFRISKTTIRSTAWRKATYYSNFDDLLTWGSEETAGWTNIGKVMGATATDLAKINSVAIADIVKMSGATV